ncbi:MAG: hypothetical protein V4533_02405 [Pseudomonadota bacterium]|jgi:hypothetical protein|nr:hypothetical protein [Sphingobium sp. CECT 9361]CAH0353769.1 hypothetical protein SPH9361_02624 [Sphingobium sp. CECT 9361]|tara:strand:- start:46 stop:183 length:138 start_codon:yes stop_codon:yes gene_type:complete
MNPDYYGLIELSFVGGIGLAFGLWQLWSVNRDIAKDRAKKDDEGK